MKYTIGFTGITGMLGKNFLDYYFSNNDLIDKYDVVGISRSEPDELIKRYGEKFKLIQYKKIDYFDKESIKEAIESVDILIHAASAKKAKIYKDYEKGNFVITKNIIDVIQEKGNLKYLIFISTQAALGPSDIYKDVNGIGKYLNEDDEPKPVSDYGKAKLKTEEFIKSYEKNWIIIRLPAVFGKYDEDSLTLFKLASKGILIDTGWKEFILSYIIAEDVHRLIFHLIEKIIKDEKKYNKSILHFCYDEPIKITEFMESIARIERKKSKFIIKIPKIIFLLVSFIASIRNLISKKAVLINKDKIREFLHTRWLISNNITKELLDIDKIEKKAKIEDIYYLYKKEGLI